MYTLKRFLLHHVVDELEQFVILAFLDASLFKLFDVHINIVYNTSSQRCKSCVGVTADVKETRSEKSPRRSNGMRIVEFFRSWRGNTDKENRAL